MPAYTPVVDSGGLRADGSCKGCDAALVSASARQLYGVLADGAVLVVVSCSRCGCEFFRYGKRERYLPLSKAGLIHAHAPGKGLRS